MTPALAQLVALVDEELRAQAAAPTREDGVDLALEIRHALVSGRPLDAREGERLQLVLREAAAQEAAALAETVSTDLATAVAGLRAQVGELGPLAQHARDEAGRLAVATDQLTEAAASLAASTRRFTRRKP